MKHTDSDTFRTSDSTAPTAPALDSYPAGKNHEDLLLTGEDNDTQWLMSDSHVDLQEMK